MKYAWINLTTSSVTNKLIGIRLLKRMIKVKKFKPKLLAPPSAKKKTKAKQKTFKTIFQSKRMQCIQNTADFIILSKKTPKNL